MNTYPDTVSFYTLMAIHAARKASRMGGGFRVWTWGKALDGEGTGRVNREQLRQYVLSLGVNPRNWQRWMNEARNNDMVTDIQDRAGEWWLILHGAPAVARAMGLQSVGSKVRMSAAALIGNGWKARVEAALEHGKQISREQIQKSFNISVRTQSYRAAQAGMIRTRNYSKSAISADKLTGIRENTKHKGCYATRDGFIAWRLPDARQSDDVIEMGKGRSRKINQTLPGVSKGLSYMQRALTKGRKTGEFVRLFNLTKTQRMQSERKVNKHNLRIRELYQMTETARSGAVIWEHYPRG